MRSRWSATLATLLGAIAVLGGSRPLAGQTGASAMPPAGTRVRLVLESALEAYRGDLEPTPRSLVATLIAVDTGSVLVRRAAGTELRLPTARVRRLEVSGPGACRGAARRARCATIGAAVGVGLGLLLTDLWQNPPWIVDCAVNPNEPGCNPAATRRHQMRALGISAAVGLSVGLVVGGETWTQVSAWPPPRY
jgi:hypothetical protein